MATNSSDTGELGPLPAEDQTVQQEGNSATQRDEATLKHESSPVSPIQLSKIDTSVPSGDETSIDDAPPSAIHVSKSLKELAKDTLPRTPVRQQSVATGQPSLPTRASSDDSTANYGAIQTVTVAGGFIEDDDVFGTEDNGNEEIERLRDVMANCWSLCQSLEVISAEYRCRVFAATSNGQLQESAWNCCWELCRFVYTVLQSDDPGAFMTRLTELCLKLARTRFEGRERLDEVDDALLKVSLEMNIHLFNIRDQSFPPMCTQRTMEFWVTLCHRLMKVPSIFDPEIEALLVGCWHLTKALFDVQFAPAEEGTLEESLSFAVDACFELAGLFRSGWSYDRPGRSTPRPPQPDFETSGRTSKLSFRTAAGCNKPEPPLAPETPITIFEDVSAAPSPSPVGRANILVLGPRPPRQPNLGPASAADLPSLATNEAELHEQMPFVHGLLLRTAMLSGWRPDPHQTIQEFVKGMLPTTFGKDDESKDLMIKYKECIRDSPMGDVDRLAAQPLRMADLYRAIDLLVAAKPGFLWIRKLQEVVLKDLVYRPKNPEWTQNVVLQPIPPR